MPLSLANVTFDCDDTLAVAHFWSEALDRPIDPDPMPFFATIGVTDETRGDAPNFFFIKVPEPKSVKNRCHVDLAVAAGEDPEAEIKRLVDLGAERVADKEEWGHSWAVMQDPEGNEFCVSFVTG